jgi:hypothetical protein
VQIISRDTPEDILEILRISKPEKIQKFLAKARDCYLEKKPIEYIGRIKHFIIDLDKVYIQLQNSVEVVYPMPSYAKAEEIEDMLENNELFYIRMNIEYNKRFKFIADTIVPVIDAIESIKELLEFKQQNGLKNWQILLASIGIKPDREILPLYLPRLISLFPIYDNMDYNVYSHILQFTTPGTGKTSFYLKLSPIWGIQIFTSFPTRAKLIFDHRTNQFGAIWHNKLIVIDAFDKTLKPDRFEEFFSMVETGLSNARWSTEASSQKYSLNMERRDVGFVFLGNALEIRHEGETISILDYFMSANAKDYRAFLQQLLKDKLKLPASMVNAFIERLSVVDFNEEQINIDKYIINYKMKAQYLKAYLNYLTNYANSIEVPSIDLGSTRLSYYAKRIAKILYMLEVLDTNDISKYQELAKKVVLGDPSWKRDLLRVGEDQQPKVPQEIYDILNGKKEGR